METESSYGKIFDKFDWTLLTISPTAKFGKSKMLEIVIRSLNKLICTSGYNPAIVFNIEEGETLCESHFQYSPEEGKNAFEEIDKTQDQIVLQCEEMEQETMYAECLNAFWSRKYVEKKFKDTKVHKICKYYEDIVEAFDKLTKKLRKPADLEALDALKTWRKYYEDMKKSFSKIHK